MHGRLGQLFGKYTEEMFFEGDQSAGNPMRYLPTPFHTKYAQQRTALSQYIQQEAVGTRMRRWERPIHDFLAPYLRGAIVRVTGEDVIPEEIRHRRDLDTPTGLGPFPAPHNIISRARAGTGLRHGLYSTHSSSGRQSSCGSPRPALVCFPQAEIFLGAIRRSWLFGKIDEYMCVRGLGSWNAKKR
jgi:hypothetical protein